MQIEKSIFKAYDIRGLYPSQITPGSVKVIAKTYVYLLGKKLKKDASELKIALGYDIREASKPLGDVFIQTCLDLGVSVDDLGLMSVNDIYFATGYYKYDGGVMMTASHNPPGYGGMKMVYLDADADNVVGVISGKQIFEKLDEAQELKTEDKKGELNQKEVLDDHLAHILKFVKKDKIKPLKVVIDSGNGMNGKLSKLALEKLGCHVIELFANPDGDFPNRAPNPLEKDAYKKCAQAVIENNADVGVMFDVDGDRMFLVDEDGKFIRGDEVLTLLAKSMLEKYPGVGIVYNLVSSHAVKELVAGWGGRAIRSEVGYKNLAHHMREEKGIMSGEVSGHFAFAENYYMDNGFIAMVLAMEAISQAGKSLSELISELKLYHRGDEVNLTVDDTQAKLDTIRQKYADNILDEIDGITVEFEDWWFNVRPSNTEPLLRVTVEAGTGEELKKRTMEVVGVIES